MSLEDGEGGLWFATAGNGLLRLPAGWRHFAVFGKGEGEPGLSTVPVRGSAPARDGRVWLVGAGPMIDRLDPASGTRRARLRHLARHCPARACGRCSNAATARSGSAIRKA